jgi:D-amino-acid dehydrogenase
VFYNTGHGHLGWTLSAVTADMVGGVVHDAMKSSVLVTADKP